MSLYTVLVDGQCVGKSVEGLKAARRAANALKACNCGFSTGERSYSAHEHHSSCNVKTHGEVRIAKIVAEFTTGVL